MNAVTTPRMLPLKTLYFFFFAGQGIFFTFVNVYYSSIGLSGTQIGLLNTVGPLVGIISGPIWGMLGDRTGKTKCLLAVSVIGVIVSSISLSLSNEFLVLLPIVAAFAMFSTTIMPLIDSTTLSLLGNQRERYGAQRVWGSIGFIITSAIAGAVFEVIGLRWLFMAYAFVMTGFLIALIWLPGQPVLATASVMSGVSTMVRQPAWLLFVASLGLLGLAMSGMSNFLGLMVKQMGGSDSLVGWMWTVAALSELPVMLLSAPLLKRIGAQKLIAIALVVYAVRMLLYGILPAPDWAVAVNLLGGLTFGLYWISAVTYANELAPAHLKATSQGILVSVTSLSMMVGAIFTGWLFDSVGSHVMFRVLAGCCVLAVLLFGAGRLFLSRRTEATTTSL